MKLPLYEEVESFWHWWFKPENNWEENVLGYYVPLIYCLKIILLFSIFYRITKNTRKNKKENFWSQYDTGGI
jgi:hypothetical protein